MIKKELWTIVTAKGPGIHFGVGDYVIRHGAVATSFEDSSTIRSDESRTDLGIVIDESYSSYYASGIFVFKEQSKILLEAAAKEIDRIPPFVKMNVVLSAYASDVNIKCLRGRYSEFKSDFSIFRALVDGRVVENMPIFYSWRIPPAAKDSDLQIGETVIVRYTITDYDGESERKKAILYRAWIWNKIVFKFAGSLWMKNAFFVEAKGAQIFDAQSWNISNAEF